MSRRKRRNKKPMIDSKNGSGENLITRKMEDRNGKLIGYVEIPISEWARCLKL